LEGGPFGKIEEKKKGMFVREMIVMPMVGTIVMTQQLYPGDVEQLLVYYYSC